MAAVRNSLGQLQADVGDIKTQVDELKTDIEENDLGQLGVDVEDIRTQVDEINDRVNQVDFGQFAINEDAESIREELESIRATLGVIEPPAIDTFGNEIDASCANFRTISQKLDDIKHQTNMIRHQITNASAFRDRFLSQELNDQTARLYRYHALQ